MTECFSRRKTLVSVVVCGHNCGHVTLFAKLSQPVFLNAGSKISYICFIVLPLDLDSHRNMNSNPQPYPTRCFGWT
jgi:hypothetical protein